MTKLFPSLCYIEVCYRLQCNMDFFYLHITDLTEEDCYILVRSSSYTDCSWFQLPVIIVLIIVEFSVLFYPGII